MFFKTFLIAIFSDVYKIQLFFPVLAAIGFQKILILLSIVGVLRDHNGIYRIKRGIYTTHGKAIIFLVVWMVLSVPFSVWPGNSFRFLTENFWKTITSFLLIVAYGTTEKALKKMIWTFILAVTIFGIVAFIFPLPTRFSIVEAYDPNENAFMFVLAFPFVYWKMKEYTGLTKILVAIILFLILVGIIKTQSRGGFLGLLAVIGVIIFQNKYALKKRIAFLIVMSVIIGSVIMIYGRDEYINRIATITDTESDYNYTDKAGRLSVWKRGLHMMTENPFLGVGVNAFSIAEGQMHVDSGGKWSAAHNSFLQVGADLGVPGFLAFCIILWSLIKNLRSIGLSMGKSTVFYRFTSYALVGSLVGFIVSGSFLTMAYTNLVFLLFGFSFAFLNIANEMNRNSGE